MITKESAVIYSSNGELMAKKSNVRVKDKAYFSHNQLYYP